jgi:hypothetical protein
MSQQWDPGTGPQHAATQPHAAAQPSGGSAAPRQGYAVPGSAPPGPTGYQPVPGQADPLVSADYGGWFARGKAVAVAGRRPLLMLQVVNAVAALLLQGPAVVYLVLVLDDAQAALGGPGGTEPPDFGAFLAALWPAAGVSAAAVLLAGLVSLVVTLASMRVVVRVAAGEHAQPGREFAAALRRLPALAGWSLLGLLLAAVGALFCILPGVYVALVLTLLPAVVLFERGGALARCFRLFHADLGAALGRVLTVVGLGIAGNVLVNLVQRLVALVLVGVGGGADGAVPPGLLVADALVGIVLQVIVSAGLAVLLIPLLVGAYAHLRARREPLTTATLRSELDRA